MQEIILTLTTHDLVVFCVGFVFGFTFKAAANFGIYLAKKWAKFRKKRLAASLSGDYSKLSNAELSKIIHDGEKDE